MGSTRSREMELKVQVNGTKKNNLPLNYELATLYFDRRMLATAEKQLQRCKDLSKTLVELEATKRSRALVLQTSRECDSRCSSRRGSAVIEQPYTMEPLMRAQQKLDGIIDDLMHVKELSGMFCTLTDEVKVLPCLLSRLTADLRDCEEWWTEIRTCEQFSW